MWEIYFMEGREKKHKHNFVHKGHGKNKLLLSIILVGL